MIKLANVTKKVNGLKIVEDVSFEVPSKKVFVILGTSGCGKTTILKMINRLIEPSCGTILVNGKDIKTEKVEFFRRQIGYVIQNVGLFPHMTVAENIAVVPSLLKWEKEKIIKRVNELLELIGLPYEDFINRYPVELSGGQKQRVGIARALAADPPIVLLDEPFGALDPITRRDMQKEFKKMKSIISKTMTLVTHDILEAFELGDLICLMDKGVIQQIGTPKELLFSPVNEFVKNFFKTNKLQFELKAIKLKDIETYLPKEIVQDKTTNLEDSISDTIEKSNNSLNSDVLFKAFYQAREEIR